MAERMNNEILLIDLQCFPSVYYYSTLVDYKILKFEQYEYLQKGSYANRYMVAGANGPILLSVPLLHAGGQKRILRDVKICNRENWQRIHWRTLTSAYRRSPWFEFYGHSLQPMYERRFSYLLDWNLQAFELINRWLGINWNFSFCDGYETSYPGDITDARHWFVPKVPQSGIANHYRQVFEERTGFLPGLSMLDLIFCEGKKAASFLKPALG